MPKRKVSAVDYFKAQSVHVSMLLLVFSPKPPHGSEHPQDNNLNHEAASNFVEIKTNVTSKLVDMSPFRNM